MNSLIHVHDSGQSPSGRRDENHQADVHYFLQVGKRGEITTLKASALEPGPAPQQQLGALREQRTYLHLVPPSASPSCQETRGDVPLTFQEQTAGP